MVFNLATAKPDSKFNMIQQYDGLKANRDDSRHALPVEILKPNQVVKMAVNAGINPTDLYQEFDSNIVTQFHLDEGEAILSRLMPLSKSISIGRTVDVYARASGMGGFETSMSGETSVIHDQVNYDSDKAIVPIHRNGFKRPFRQAEQFGLEGFQDLTTMQMQAVRTHKKGLIDFFMNGTTAKAEGIGWNGFRADSRVDQVDLGASGENIDFTSALTGKEFYAGFKALAERRYVDNNITAPATWFVSNQIWWKMDEDYSDEKGDNTILQRVMKIPGVGEIVPSSVLTGNEILSMPLSSEYVQPIVGAGVSTIALPRPQYNSPLAFDVMSAIGIQVKSDFATGNKAVQYAAS